MGLGGVAQGRQPPGLPSPGALPELAASVDRRAARLARGGARRAPRRGDLPRAHAAILPPFARSQNGLPDPRCGPSGASVQAEGTRPFLGFSSRRHPASGVPAQAALRGLPRRVSPTSVGLGKTWDSRCEAGRGSPSLSAPRESAPDQALEPRCAPNLTPPGGGEAAAPFPSRGWPPPATVASAGQV